MHAMSIDDALQKIGVCHAWYFYRILKGEKYAGKSAFINLQFKKILSLVLNRSAHNLIFISSGQNIRESAFARTIRSHDGMHFSVSNGQGKSIQDGLACNINV